MPGQARQALPTVLRGTSLSRSLSLYVYTHPHTRVYVCMCAGVCVCVCVCICICICHICAERGDRCGCLRGHGGGGERQARPGQPRSPFNLTRVLCHLAGLGWLACLRCSFAVQGYLAATRNLKPGIRNTGGAENDKLVQVSRGAHSI